MISLLIILLGFSEPKVIDSIEKVGTQYPSFPEFFARDDNNFCFLDNSRRVWLFSGKNDRKPVVFGGPGSGPERVQMPVSGVWIRQGEVQIIHGSGKLYSRFSLTGELIKNQQIPWDNGHPFFPAGNDFMRFETVDEWFTGVIFGPLGETQLFPDQRQYDSPIAFLDGETVLVVPLYGNHPKTPFALIQREVISKGWIETPVSSDKKFFEPRHPSGRSVRPLLQGVTVSPKFGFVAVSPLLDFEGADPGVFSFSFVSKAGSVSNKVFRFPSLSALTWWAHLSEDIWIAWNGADNEYVWLNWSLEEF